MTHQLLEAVHTRACTGIKKNAHNSVTVQIRTHVYMNFFDHKNLGNHLLQLFPKVVKHPVCVLILSCFTQIWIFLDRFSQKCSVSDLTTTRPFGAEFIHAGRRPDGHDEAKRLLSRFMGSRLINEQLTVG